MLPELCQVQDNIDSRRTLLCGVTIDWLRSKACFGAQDDRTITSMVPASVRVRREEPTRLRTVTGASALARSRALTGPEAGFGLAPAPAPVQAASAPTAIAAPKAAGQGTAMDKKYQAFLAEMSQLGAV